MIALELTGKPEGKGRARVGRGGVVFTPQATRLAEGRIIEAWKDAGQPRLEGPIALTLVLKVARPKSHFTAKGELNTEGKRKPWPTGKKPDLDNALKLVMDALNGRAYRDDVDVVSVSASRLWASDGWESTSVVVAAYEPSGVPS